MSDPMASASPDYEVLDFNWDTSHGHMVSMLLRRPTRGIVIDLGCGSAPHAEPLRDAGFTYVGLDFNPNCVRALEQRGFPGRSVDLRDIGDLAQTLDNAALLGRGAASGHAEVVAVLSLDVMEHLVDPHLVLHAVSEWMLERSVPVLGLSIPNVSHRDLAFKLLAAHWDLTESGLLDATHLRFFTHSSLTMMMRRSGFREMDRMDSLDQWSDQHWPIGSPLLHTTTPLGRFLNDLRDRADSYATTYQFVRLFEPRPVESTSPTLHATTPPQDRAFRLAVVADPELSCSELDDLATDLKAQTADSWSMTNTDGIDSSVFTHVAFIEAGQRVGANWVQQFMDAAALWHGMLLRCGSDAELVSVENADSWPNHFDLIEHLSVAETPGVALAIPIAAIDALGFDLKRDHKSLVAAIVDELAAYCGVHDTGVAAAAARRRPDENRRICIGDTERAIPVLVNPLSLAELVADRARLRALVESNDLRLAALTDDNRWLNAELRMTPVRALRRLLRRPRPARQNGKA